MASRSNAKLNNLNDRAREVGRGFEQLTLNDLDALRHFYNHTCLKCGKSPAISPDHVIPLSLGGSNTVENLQLLCDEDNKAKGNRDSSDYRQGKVLTRELADDWIAQNKQNPQQAERTYKKHDWESAEKEYFNSNLTTRELATKLSIPYPTLRDYSIRHEWEKRRKEIRSRIVAESEQEIIETVTESIVAHELSARTALFQVIEDAISAWQTNPKPSTRDLAELLKLGLVAQGGITDRTAHVDPEHDDAALLARLNKVFDGGQETRTYTPIGLDGEETSAGYSDSI